MQYSIKYKDLNPQEIGEQAGKRAVRLLGASTVNSQQAPIVLEPYIATNFRDYCFSFIWDLVQKANHFWQTKWAKKLPVN